MESAICQDTESAVSKQRGGETRQKNPIGIGNEAIDFVFVGRSFAGVPRPSIET